MSAGAARLAESVIEELWFGDEDPGHGELEASRSLAAALATSTGLKPFPVVLARALTLLRNVDEPRSKVVALLEQDPALCARLLRVANSALYAPKRECVSVSDAIMRLGNKNVSDIISGIAVFGMFSDVDGLGSRVRDHCARVASMARVLAIEWCRDGAEHVFLAGLMHDVGKLLMMQAGTPRYDLLDPKLLEVPDRIHLSERALTGFDHATLGAHVLKAWQFPSDVARVVAWHHQPGRAFAAGAEIGLPVALIRLADRIEMTAGRGAEPNPEFCDSLSGDESAAYTNFAAKDLRATWPKLRAACEQTLGALK
ncbi:MAG: HDOD domain-containing protein [Myxococcota bacterium]